MSENKCIKSERLTDTRTQEIKLIEETAMEDKSNILKPNVIDNDQISILNHTLLNKKDREKGGGKGVAINLKNIANMDIGKAILNITFYDVNGNILDEIESIITDLERDKTRVLRIETAKASEVDIRSYDIKIGGIIITPQPIVTGNDRIEILNHSFSEADPKITAVDIAIKNISGKTIATAIFEAIFYDSEGHILDTVKHKELEINVNKCRAIVIASSKIKEGFAKSYKVTLLKAITTDVEKVHLRAHRIRTNEDGAEEVEGFLKNISNVIADVALVATFKDSKDILLGSRILLIKDIEINCLKKFNFIFYPPKGEIVKTYTLDLAEIETQ